MRTLLRIVVAIFLSLILACASDPVYYPGNQITPMFDKADQFEIRVNKLGFERGVGATMAYAESNDKFTHLGIEYADGQQCQSCSSYKTKSVEVAFGRYKWIESRNIYEYIVGGGIGQVESNQGGFLSFEESEYVRTDFTRGFFQLNYGNRFRYIDVIASIRGTYFQTMDFQYINYSDGRKHRLEGQSWNIYINPAMTLQTNIGWLGLHAQLGTSFGLMDVEFGSDRSWGLVGVSFRIQ